MKNKKIRKLIYHLILMPFVGCQIINDDTDPTQSMTIITLKNDECCIYLKHVVWGMSTDNSITYISKNKSWEDTVQEPYFKVLDFFYKLDTINCSIIISKSDSLHRSHLSRVSIKLDGTDTIDYDNYKLKGFDNILYN